MSDLRSLIGLAKKAGRLEVGEEPVGAACRGRKAKLVLLASDAAANTYRRAAHFGETGRVLFLSLPHTKSELGGAVGRTSCAMVAVTDIGFAAAMATALARDNPGQYGGAAEQLRDKADKALQRQREQRQHEKRLQKGLVKPWVPPPAKAQGPGVRPGTPPAKGRGSRAGTRKKPRAGPPPGHK
ncbi:MAG: 50S ribosomal protein L7 [Clostridiales bacterium]|nr:50S ribosomal protein L7 [Clostridiales bacterium]